MFLAVISEFSSIINLSGYSPSMLNAIRNALVTGTVHTCYNGAASLNFKEAFFLATVGGSQVIGCEDKLGNFMPGKEFDALVIDPECPDSPFDVFEDTNLEIFEKFIHLGDDRNIDKIYVKGKDVTVHQ